MKSKKQIILDLLSDAWMDLLYYDRKEDEDVPMDFIENAIIDGDITIDEMIANFKKQLEVNVKGIKEEGNKRRREEKKRGRTSNGEQVMENK